MKLEPSYIEKPWGRTKLPPSFDPPPSERIGEVWFTGADDQPLLVKYLFTSERLSIQVHPDDEQARARGRARGKSECWYIVDAEPEARLGLGLKTRLFPDQLREAALDGSIVELMDWRPVRAGDFFLVPPGTIHAIGAGISLIEFQQNSDVTYRLYDYGRPRDLHLEDGVAVARAEPYPGVYTQHLFAAENRILVDGPEFVLIHSNRDALKDRTRWIIPLEGKVRHGGESAGPGDCLLLGAGDRIEAEAVRMLIGATA
ncbi:MAG TPA: class I mannose-6-phosphate isomerase [Sphingomicrobium sp.]|jgi:mannose-6-phosphate isomerase|nr:class I mannose-6-phosphate isomerase [Sphingomicrobium sp.]